MPIRPVSRHPVVSLTKLIREEHLRADVLVVPGDLTNRADHQGLRTGWDHVRSIRGALKARHVIATLGNHDIYRDEDPPADPLCIAKDTHEDFPVRGAAEKDQYFNHCFCAKRTRRAAFVAINTVPLSNGPLAAEGGQVSEDCLEAMDKELAKLGDAPFRIALCHHHPIAHDDVGPSPQDLIQNADKFMGLLAKHRFDLVLHGHKHYPRLRTAPASSHRIAVLAAGSLSAILDVKLMSRTRNTFHIVRLQRESLDAVCQGIVNTWEFHLEGGWTPASRTSADLPHQAGFGSTTEPQELATSIATDMNASGSWNEPWDSIVAQYPDVQYLEESQRARFEAALDKYQMEVDWPEPPVRPRRISRITPGGQ